MTGATILMPGDEMSPEHMAFGVIIGFDDGTRKRASRTRAMVLAIDATDNHYMSPLTRWTAIVIDDEPPPMGWEVGTIITARGDEQLTYLGHVDDSAT